jgi:iron complex outermembrane receptor protein
VNSNFGVLYDGRISGFKVDLAAFRSIFDIDRTDHTLISLDVIGRTSATAFCNPDRAKRSDSAEARVDRQLEAGGLSHMATVSLRGGRSSVHITSNLAAPLGTFDLAA